MALWVELGHAIRPGKRRQVLISGWVQPRPFMRQAFEASIADAAEAFIEARRVELDAVEPAASRD